MRHFGKWLLLLVMPLVLTGCFFSPGKFVSDMTVYHDGRFTFAYQGEILFMSPDQMKRHAGGGKGEDEQKFVPQCWDDAQNKARPCTAAEDKEQRAQEARNRKDREAREKKEQERFAEAFGFNPDDAASMQRFAANLTKHAGWKSAVYKGDGVFMVDYQVSGALDRDFVWPVYPDTSTAFPMVVVRKRADGSVQISAPAFVNGNEGKGMLGMMAGLESGNADKPATSMGRTEGVFTIRTDAEILTNNTIDAPAREGGMRVLRWQVAKGINRPAPETLLQVR